MNSAVPMALCQSIGAACTIASASDSVRTIGCRKYARGSFTPSSGRVSRCPSICADFRQLRRTAICWRTLLAQCGPATCAATQVRTWCGWILTDVHRRR